MASASCGRAAILHCPTLSLVGTEKMKRRYKQVLPRENESGVEGVGLLTVLVFSTAVLYLTENLLASASLFMMGLLVVNGGLFELLYLMRRRPPAPPLHPLRGTRNFVTPYPEGDEDG